jgi:hypothetical protein
MDYNQFFAFSKAKCVFAFNAMSAALLTIACMVACHFLCAMFCGVMLMAAVAGLYALRSTCRNIGIINEALKKAASGEIDSRIVLVPDSGLLKAFASLINDVLDLTEAFAKEAGAATETPNHRRYYRQIVQPGLTGHFLQYAITINRSWQNWRLSHEDIPGGGEGRGSFNLSLTYAPPSSARPDRHVC